MVRNQYYLQHICTVDLIFPPEISSRNLDKKVSVHPKPIAYSCSILFSVIIENWLMKYAIFWWSSATMGAGAQPTILVLEKI